MEEFSVTQATDSPRGTPDRENILRHRIRGKILLRRDLLGAAISNETPTFPPFFQTWHQATFCLDCPPSSKKK